ncbi:hypothetical protein AVEN_119856-1, partial [Araneus ventricosus]
MRRPSVLSGYYQSSEMDPKSHNTMTIPPGEASSCLVIGSNSSMYSR